jgi:hypothetical protein
VSSARESVFALKNDRPSTAQYREELLRRAAVVREKRRTVQGEVRNQMAGVRYVWERHDDNTIARRRVEGYEIVRNARWGKNSEGKEDRNKFASRQKGKGPDTDFHRDDGSHVYGDQILMQVQTDMYEALKASSELEALDRVSQGHQRGVDAALSQGVAASLEPEDTSVRT